MAALEATPSLPLPADGRTWQLLLTSLILVGTLLAAAVVLALVRRWRRGRQVREEDVSPAAQLAQFRSLYEAGAMSAEEFERLRAVLGTRMRQDEASGGR